MKVIVLGGGIAGLFTASELIAAGIEDVVVLDQAPVPGGVLQTLQSDGFSLEAGAGSFNLPHPHLSPILRRAGVEVAPAAATNRFVFRSGRLLEIPASPKAILAPLLPASAKLRALAEPFVGRGGEGHDETLASFCKRRFGQASGELIAWLMASGVYAGDPHELSARAAFPRLAELEAADGSVVRGGLRAMRRRPDHLPRSRAHIPVGGMVTFARTMASSLGDRYRPDFVVTTVRPTSRGWAVDGTEQVFAGALVLATHPRMTADLVDTELAAHLRRSVSTPVVTVGLGAVGDSPLPHGFGALITPDNQMVSRGLVFESSYAPERSPEGAWLLKVIAGGSTFPGVVDWDDERILAAVTGEAGTVLGSDLSTEHAVVVRHRPGIPQYLVGHRGWLRELDGLLERRPGLYVTGWGYRGIGVAQQASDAALTAARLLAGSAEELS